jgi:hypothetical protein
MGGAPAAGVIAALRMLHLDHFGAELPEDQAGKRGGNTVADLHDDRSAEGRTARQSRCSCKGA